MRGEDLNQELIILYTYKFSLHKRGFIRFYDNPRSTRNKRLEVTIIYQRGKENEHRVDEQGGNKKLILHQERF